MCGTARALAPALAAALLLGGPCAGAPATGDAPAATQKPVTPPPAQPQDVPTAATLGLPVYPGAQFLASYDAGRGQRFYLFGTTASFTEVIAYYKTVLSQKGELVFDEPGVYVFEVGRFREDTMAFPPGVTIKDYASGGRKGYLNPRPGAQPARFPTIVQIVPLQPGPPGHPAG